MDKKGKSVIIFGLIAVLAFAAFSVVGIAHENPQGKQTHEVGLETDSCQGALAGAEEQFNDRGKVNPRLLANIEDKCGIGEACITRVECGERGEGWSVHPIDEELCESGLACGIAAEFDCICP